MGPGAARRGGRAGAVPGRQARQTNANRVGSLSVGPKTKPARTDGLLRTESAPRVAHGGRGGRRRTGNNGDLKPSPKGGPSGGVAGGAGRRADDVMTTMCDDRWSLDLSR